MFKGIVTNYYTKTPMENVRVTDGLNIVYTDAEGKYELPGWEHARVISVGLLTDRHDDWYINVEGHKGDFNFYVKPVTTGDNFCFLHMSDSEIENRRSNDWIDFGRKIVKDEQPAFFINTGDLCREDGLSRHYLLMNSDSFGCPVRYAIGNHDMLNGEYGEYGEQFFEKHYGPTWYSFDCGKMHFVVLSIGMGDSKSGYRKEDREEWLKRDLELKPDDMGVVLMCHHFHPNPNGYGHTVKRIAETAGDKNLKALVFGHDHYCYVYDYENFIGICSARPDSGGVDSSPAGSRKIIVKGTELSSEYIYNVPENTAKQDKYEWCTELEGNVEFSSPIEADGAAWVCTSDDGYPEKCGIYKLDSESGKILAYIKTGRIKGDASYSDGMLYAQDSHGVLYCVDTEKAELVWTAKTPLDIYYTRRGVLVVNDKVLAGDASKLTAYNKKTGEVVWVYNGASGPCPSRYVYDSKRNRILIPGQWKGIYSISADTGEQIWAKTEGHLNWFNTSTPYLLGDVIYKRGDVNLAILNAEDGEIITSTRVPTSLDVSGSCASDDKLVYVPTVNCGVFGVDKETLDVKLVFSTHPSRLFTAPYRYGNLQTVETTPVIKGEQLIFAASDGYIHMYNKNNGYKIKEINVGSPVISNPVYGDGYIITADFSGKVKKFRI